MINIHNPCSYPVEVSVFNIEGKFKAKVISDPGKKMNIKAVPGLYIVEVSQKNVLNKSKILVQ